MKSINKIQITAKTRTVIGGGLNKVRAEGYIPAVLYGKNQESLNIQIVEKDFINVLKEAGESTLVYLTLDGEVHPTIIHDVTKNPISGKFLHADFYKVRLDEKIKAMVPVEFEGEAPAVKSLGGIFVRNINEIEVEALPQNLPHKISVDVSRLENIDDQILVKDIKLENGVEIIADENEIIALVQEPISEEQLQKELEKSSIGVEDVEEIKKEKDEDESSEDSGEETKEEAKE